MLNRLLPAAKHAPRSAGRRGQSGCSRQGAPLVERLHRTNLLMIVGDSGSGKSSIARAGLLPRFRGGAFADKSGDQPDRTFWQVIEMRPQGKPVERLVDAISEAALKA